MGKLLFDFFPIFLFFLSYKWYDIYVATAVAIGASFAQVFIYWLGHRRFEKMHVITLVLITLLGSATLILHEEIFIKWKPTAINWIFALVFALSHVIGKRTMIQHLLDGNIELPDKIWRRLNFGWVLFFVTLGAVNLFVVYHFSTDIWVNFKLFGMLGLTLVFIIAQSLYLAKYVEGQDLSPKS